MLELTPTCSVSSQALNLIRDRNSFSQSKIRDLSLRLKTDDAIKAFPRLAIFAVGSYGRLEASEHSDIDLFFIMNDNIRRPLEDFNLKRMRVLASIIKHADAMEFPNFSNDGEFLGINKLSLMMESLGGREDDYLNHFTVRMLLLLESRPVYGASHYQAILESVVDSYFRDYEFHPGDFKPTFLVNDIVRFWKTLCLNYEHKRNRPANDVTRRRKQQIRNFKLKFSRLLTCYATVAFLSCHNHISKQEIIQITAIPPIERIVRVLERFPALSLRVSTVIELYCWFLSLTALTTEKLETYFNDDTKRTEAFLKAEEFGHEIFEIVRFASDHSGSLRYLLV